MKVMIWCAARGGMRSVVEAYQRDGFLDAQQVRLISSYKEGGFLKRQIIFVCALFVFLWCLTTKSVSLVHLHAAMRGSFWRKSIFAMIARRFGVAVIFHLHGSEMQQFYISQPKLLQAQIRHQLEKAARVIVLSESWKTFVESVAPAARVTVVPNYVVVPSDGGGLSRNPQDILFLGFVGKRKGVFDLIPAFALIAKSYPQARLLIGGNGQIEEANALIAQYKLEKQVVMLGWVSGERKEKLLATSGIFILPSYNEGLPMSVLEAMAAKLAVITTTVGGIPELITHGTDGLLVLPGDIPALSKALLDLLSNDVLRNNVAAAGKRRVAEHYSAEVVLSLLDSIYRAPEGLLSATPGCSDQTADEISLKLQDGANTTRVSATNSPPLLF